VSQDPSRCAWESWHRLNGWRAIALGKFDHLAKASACEASDLARIITDIID
jgi:hypothetical protein